MSRVAEAAALMREDDGYTFLAVDHYEFACVIADALTAIEAATAWEDWPSVHAALNRVAETYLEGT